MSKNIKPKAKDRVPVTIYLEPYDREMVEQHRLTMQPQPKFSTLCAWLVLKGLAAVQGGGK